MLFYVAVTIISVTCSLLHATCQIQYINLYWLILHMYNCYLSPSQLNFNSATKEYLERFLQKKRENIKKSEAVGTEGGQEIDKEEGKATGSEEGVPSESTQEESKEDSITDQKDQDMTKFGLVTDEDREADQGIIEKLNGMIEERLKTHPLPPPPPPPVATDGSGTLSQEGSKERDMDVDRVKNGESCFRHN